ncbi:sigma-70 family RNA polymerase sigma factor [Comamonas squillarum]|jgi:RNA polymerase sigma factor (sigma-70 family)|uniref:Sigma-70 family RNA polymerase sigma factor n=1 Tax=Comamonas squillarum TaxID=2977320 RepID=A0ABY6A2W8_9BURK|nr:sigma-70 family RNA polymerase sigma factor [Comamonas sp. PR12]UXC19899.1 sigma-70 family RNA polymerase sigma factor [Comamonas sp. PR12]
MHPGPGIPPSPSVDPVQALYEAHHSWLVARLRRKLGCAWDAADLAQNTFVRVLGTQRPQLQALLEPRAYLTTIAQRLLSNHLRRRQIERAYLDALALLPEPVAPPPDAQLMVLETLVAIDRLLGGLPVVARKAFLLWRLEDLTQEEIAQQLGISRTSVRRHLAAAAERCYFADQP